MKRQIIWKVGIFVYLVAAAIMVGCLDKGDQGPVGLTGGVGPKGDSGAMGQVPALQCMACHNTSTRIKAKQIEYENSGHFKNGNFERSTSGCAGCHTAEGFVMKVSPAKPGDTISNVTNPTPVSCYACHFVHKSYDSTDFKLRVDSVGTVKFTLTDSSKAFAFGKGNICATCHQPRRSPPTLVATDSITVTATYGPHYGVQSSVLEGFGGFQIPGSEAYSGPGLHASLVKNTCVDCHMAAPAGDKTGGHQMGLKSVSESGTVGYSTTGCTKCHTGGLALPKTGSLHNYKGAQDTIQTLYKSLTFKLQTMGVLDTLADPHPKSAKRIPVVAGAIFNWSTIKNDASWGVHNYGYSKALLKNTLDTLNKLYP